MGLAEVTRTQHLVGIGIGTDTGPVFSPGSRTCSIA